MELRYFLDEAWKWTCEPELSSEVKIVIADYRPVTPDLIIRVVSEYFNQDIDKVISTSRKREYLQSRQIAMYFMREIFGKGITFEDIGVHFDGKGSLGLKDHATIIHSIQTVKNLIETDKYYKSDIEILAKKFKSFEKPSAPTKEELLIIKHEQEMELLMKETTAQRNEIIALRTKISELQGKIYGLSLQDQEPEKREYLESNLAEDKNRKPVRLPLYATPYEQNINKP